MDNEKKGSAPATIPLIIGTHSIMARAANFLDVAQSVLIEEGQQKKFTVSMMTYEGSRQASADAWGRSKWISAGLAALAGGVSVYLSNQSDDYYNKYRLASTGTAAVSARDNADKFTMLTNVARGTAVAGVASALISWIIQATR